MTATHESVAPSPFTRPASLPEPGLLDRLFRRSRPLHAERDLQAVLVSSRVDQVTPRVVSDILARHRVAGREAHSILVRLWSLALERFLADDALSDPEVAYLFSLRRAFDLGGDDIMKVEEELVHPRFRSAIADVMSDQRVTEEERAALTRLGRGLRISPWVQTEAFRSSASELLTRLMDANLADRRLSPDEQENFAIVARQLGINASFDEATESLLNRCALLWRIENGDIPIVDVPIQLQRGEVCHFVTPASWHEFRKSTRTVGYYSQGVSLRIARGVYYRVGASRPQRVTTEGLTEIDAGTLYLTSKRVLFDGATKNSSIRLSNLIGYEVYSDGLKLEKGSGRSPYLLFEGDAELAAVILGRLLAA